MGQMEIRIILDRAEPPAGRLRAVPDPGHCHAGPDEEIRFTGWLGLLRALYEVTGARRRLCSGALTRARPAALGRSSRSSIRLMGTLAPVPGIRGRAAEIAVLGDAVDRVVSGWPAVVLIEGEAGIGKTRLLAGVLEDARGRGMQVAAARAEELERTRPFGLVAAAFGCVRSSPDPRRAAIAALLATQGGDRGPITVTSDPGLRFRAVDAFADLAEELALGGPLVIGVDDLQWADPSSLLTLAAVSRRLADLPVALIGCLRPSPRIPELDRLAGLLLDAGGRILAVRGLTERAVAELVAEAVAAVPGPGLLAGISGAAGNPLFVTELLGALTQEGAIETAGGRAEVAEVTLPPTLRLTILRRLSFLSEDTLQALRSASILGSSFTVTELSVTMARPALELSVVLAEGIAGRVLEEYGAVIRFRHDLIRDAIYEDLPLSVRRGLHREAGQRLARTGAPALQVAEQLARGAGQGDAEAIGWLTRAAREAAARSPDIAASLLERAAGLMAPADPGRDRLLAERASSLMVSGRIADTLAACRSLLHRDLDPQVDGAVRICLGRALLAEGQVRDALQELEQAGSSPALPGAERAAARAWAGFARVSLGDLDGAAASAEQARSAAASAGDHLTVSVAMTTLARISESRGHLRDALQITDEAVHLADESPGRLGHRPPQADGASPFPSWWRRGYGLARPGAAGSCQGLSRLGSGVVGVGGGPVAVGGSAAGSHINAAQVHISGPCRTVFTWAITTAPTAATGPWYSFGSGYGAAPRRERPVPGRRRLNWRGCCGKRRCARRRRA